MGAYPGHYGMQTVEPEQQHMYTCTCRFVYFRNAQDKKRNFRVSQCTECEARCPKCGNLLHFRHNNARLGYKTEHIILVQVYMYCGILITAN